MKRFLTIVLLTATMFIMGLSKSYSCAISTIVSNGNETIVQNATYRAEPQWLAGTASVNPNGWGYLFYHPSTHPGYQLLPTDETPSHHDTSAIPIQHPYNGLVATFDAILDPNNSNDVKIFMAHARKRSSGEPPGVFAPFVMRNPSNNVDYSFAHHGTINKNDFIHYIPGFGDYLAVNFSGHYTDPDSYVDSEYIFILIVKCINESEGNVKQGLSMAIQQIGAHVPGGSMNIVFSDGNGVYAFSNGVSTTAHMGFKEYPTSNGRSYLIRSWGEGVTSWNQSEYTSIITNALYYFPTSGNMDITYSAPMYHGRVDLKNGFNYLCFPVLTHIHGLDPDYTLREINQYAGWLETKQNDLLTVWDYDPDQGEWPNSLVLNRQNGYILQLSDYNNEYYYLSYGYATPPSEFLTLNEAEENWVPYFLSYSQTPQAAFGANFALVQAIYAQDWFIYKKSGVWYGQIQPGATATLDYGKMYKVYVNQNIPSFQWAQSSPTKPLEKQNTEFFVFEDKSEYQGLVISSIEGMEEFDEIGVFKGDVCVGATKFDGYPINIQVYDDSTPTEFTFAVYSDTKQANGMMPMFSRSNVEIEDIVLKEGKHFFSILNIKGNPVQTDMELPATSVRLYPNPAHSLVNIEIKSTMDYPVDICIYNVRGQLIRTLSNVQISKGKTTVEWNGKMADGTRVLPGLYFCSIKNKNNVLTRKRIIIM